MKIIVIGATGIIGKAVAAALTAKGHEVVPVARKSGAFRADLTDKDSIERVLRDAGTFDAVVSAAGEGRFKPLADLTDDDFAFSLSSKLMGQVNLARLALPLVADNGSITLTSGVLSDEPMPGGAAISLVNAGLNGFVRSAALETPRGVRVNIVSPPWVSETLTAMGRDPSGGTPAARVAEAYVRSVEGTDNGRVIDARG